MYGAILGDIIGSPFEFDRGDKTKNFDLFSEGCGFTDDSVMTIAVGEALLAVGPKAAVTIMLKAVRKQCQKQLSHFWNPKILRTQCVMQYHLVEIRIHLEPLQEVLQKHFMESRLC